MLTGWQQLSQTCSPVIETEPAPRSRGASRQTRRRGKQFNRSPDCIRWQQKKNPQMVSSCSCSFEDWDGRWGTGDTRRSSVKAHLLHNTGRVLCPRSLLPSPISHCSPSSLQCHHNASRASFAFSAKRAILFWTRQNRASCQVRFGPSLLVSTDRIWNPALCYQARLYLCFEGVWCRSSADTITSPTLRTVNSNTNPTAI